MNEKRCLGYVLALMTIFKDADGVSFNNSIVWTMNKKMTLFTISTVTDWVNERLPLNISGLDTNHAVFSFAYDYHSNMLVLSHPEKHMLTVLFLDSEQLVVYYLGTSKDVGQLTIDWKARNVYWADGGFGWIAMKPLPESSTFNSLSQTFRIVVDNYLDKPTGIKVHPEKYFLFWADAGVKPKIERSNLVGGERKVIVWFNLMYPTCLTIDSSSDRLYWSDQSRGTIEYSDFDGNDRNILVSNPEYDYYGIAVFQESLLYTVPNQNKSGFLSLRENVLGRAGDISTFNVPLYFVDIFTLESQPREVLEGCDSIHINCDQICLHARSDRGASCYCEDGFSLYQGDGETCSADSTVLERHLLFTNDSSVCSVGINIINEAFLLEVDCDVVRHNASIRAFAINMADSKIYFASDWSIFAIGTHQARSELALLVEDSTHIIDMDYNWQTNELFWIVDGGDSIAYMDLSEDIPTRTAKVLLNEVTNIAVDPHKRNVFYIIMSGSTYSLHVWHRDGDDVEQIHTIHLQSPSDLEYDRLNDRLVWNDDLGHVGYIYTNGTGEKRISTESTGQGRHAITAFKKYVITTTGEVNREIDSIYDRDGSQMHISFNQDLYIQRPIRDIHVFDTTLQPTELEPCEDNNGGCEHICIPDMPRRCSCFLGYRLGGDGVSCSTTPIQSDFFLVLDSQSGTIYQTAEGSQGGDIRAITLNSVNKPSAIAMDLTRNTVTWVDRDSGLVKQKQVDGTQEIAFGTNVDGGSDIAIDVTGGNVYVASGQIIAVLDKYNNMKTIVDDSIEGNAFRIALLAEKGWMAWLERGSRSRVVMASMDGSNVRAFRDSVNDGRSDIIRQPEDLAFDTDTKSHVYWCDSELDKIEKVTIASAAADVIFSGLDLYPVALDIEGQYIYFIPKFQRKIFRISKDGTGITLITESPLFGQLTYLIAFKSTLNPHNTCAECNGGCSTLCLPRGTSRVCACGSGATLRDDGKTCTTVDRCPPPTETLVGLQDFTQCCTDHPRAECYPVCQPSYTLQHNYRVKCVNGRWNVTDVCKSESSDDTDLPLPLIAGGAGGGVVLIIIIIVVVILYKRKRTQKRPTSNPPGSIEFNSVHANSSSRPSFSTANLGAVPPIPTDMPLTEEEEADGGEYHYLDDKLLVRLPDDKSYENGHVKNMPRKKNSYSTFPESGNYGYITPAYDLAPKPDYPDYGLGETNGGYLAAASIGPGPVSERGTHFPNEYLEFTDSNVAKPIGVYHTNNKFNRKNKGSQKRIDERQNSLSGFDAPVPRNSSGDVFDMPQAHLQYMHGSGSGSGSGSSPYKSRISRY